MNILEEPYVMDLVFNCSLRRDHKACRTLEVYVAQARIHSIIDLALGLKVKPPIKGPGPGPEPEREKSETLQWLLDGDPDGNPARIFPTMDFTSDPKRLKVGHETAVQLKDAIMKVLSALDGDIKELEKRVNR